MIKDTYVRARATELEKQKYNKLAKDLGVSLSELIRELLENKLKEVNK